MKKLLPIFILFSVSQMGLAQEIGIFNIEDLLKFDTINSPKILTDTTSSSGVVAVKVCVNREGSVISAEILEEQTSTTSQRLKDLAIENAKKYKFTAKSSAPDVQCGTVTYDFKVK